MDLINSSNPPQYFTPSEFLFEKTFIRLAPYSTLCWGVYVQARSPGTDRVLYEHSISRLQRNLFSSVDPSNNMIYAKLLDGLNESLEKFSAAVLDISSHQPPSNVETNLAPFLQQVLYYISTVGGDQQVYWVFSIFYYLRISNRLVLIHLPSSCLCTIKIRRSNHWPISQNSKNQAIPQPICIHS